jgi:hypothetical protein
MNFSQPISVASKIQWTVDLSLPSATVLSPKIMKLITKGSYDKLDVAVLDSSQIWDLFFPQYVELIMNRSDYHLEKHDSTAKIKSISQDQSYKLMWFGNEEQQIMIGGVILHLLPNKISIAYRCFDRNIATSLGVPLIDYFCEIKTREYAQSLNYTILSHGRDNHPLDSLGLATWKLRIGAIPSRSKAAVDVSYTPQQLQELALPHGVGGYFAQQVGNSYTKFYLCGDHSSDAAKNFVRVAERSGIEVIFEGNS